jgi:N-acetyl-gamma-glutamyl-phosphate reductase
MQPVSIGVIGGSGYSGMELLSLLSRHEGFRVAFATSDRWEGRKLREKVLVARGGGGGFGDLAFCSVEQGLSMLGECQVVALATPAPTSLAMVPEVLKAGVRVVDLAGSFRLKDAGLYPRFYAFEHTAKALLGQAVYGLTEWFRSDIPRAALVANPGCYATAAALALAPFLKKQLLTEDTLVINAASGISGAGRKATEEYGYMEIAGDFRAYRTHRHQHMPEISQTLGRVAQRPVDICFTPHLLPMKRGILCTAFAKARPGTTQAQVREALEEAFGGEPLVELCASPDDIRIASVVCRPHIQVAASLEGDKLVVASALDNLLKGAAGQALQNLNLMFGYSETLGLL